MNDNANLIWCRGGVKISALNLSYYQMWERYMQSIVR